jgi:hypothetical protein
MKVKLLVTAWLLLALIAISLIVVFLRRERAQRNAAPAASAAAYRQ